MRTASLPAVQADPSAISGAVVANLLTYHPEKIGISVQEGARSRMQMSCGPIRPMTTNGARFRATDALEALSNDDARLGGSILRQDAAY